MSPGRSRKDTESQETRIQNPLEETPGESNTEEQPPPKTYSKITLSAVDDDVLGRARGYIAKVNMEGELEPGVDDMSSLVTKALQSFIPRMEKKYNNNEQFPAPKRLPRGRKPSR